jgi:hypothetical protein
MVNSPILIIFEMLKVVFVNTIQTSQYVFGLFFELLSSLSYIISISGLLGIFIAFIILMPLVYFIIKFLSGGIKLVLLVILILAFFSILILLISF